MDSQLLLLPQCQFPESQNDGGARIRVAIVLDQKWLIRTSLASWKYFPIMLGERDSKTVSRLSGKVLIWLRRNNINFLSIL